MRPRHCLVLAYLLVPIGCDRGDLPDRFRVRGQAKSIVEGVEISCRMDLTCEQRGFVVDPERGRVIRVEWSGDAQRTVLAPDGSGISLAPFMHDPNGQVDLFGGNRIEILSPINLESGVPFYVSLGRLPGRLSSDGSGSGTWECSPFEVREDSVGTVAGTWTLDRL